jgi:hypothetical protein
MQLRNYRCQPTDRHMREVITPRSRDQGFALNKPRLCFRRLMLVSLGLRPNLTPRAFALCLPSAVRLRIRCRSNSARPPSTVTINLPCLVSAQPSPNDLRLAPHSATAARVFTSASPASSEAIQRAKTARSVLAPGARLLLSEHPRCSFLPQGSLLCIECLFICAHASIANHHFASPFCA